MSCSTLTLENFFNDRKDINPFVLAIRATLMTLNVHAINCRNVNTKLLNKRKFTDNISIQSEQFDMNFGMKVD